jgi:hypothetical protein
VKTTPAELDSDRLKEITKQLAEDVRPLVGRLQPVIGQTHPLIERARLWAADALAPIVPIVEATRPVFNDLRPVMHDLRALLGELLHRVGVAGSRLDLGPVKSVGRMAGASAERLASMRPTLPSVGPSLSLPAVHAPQVAALRVPSIRPRIVGAAGALARRLRPGLWAFRTAAIGLIILVISQPWLRDAMVDEVNWTRSVLQSIEIPAIQLPNVELPAFQIPTIEIPTNLFASHESAAPPKLAPAPFDLPPLNAYRAAFETQASYPTVPPNATVEWVVALRNTGSAGWYRGVAGAQASLALTDGTEAAVQTTGYVAPGQVGWFIVHFRAPAGPGAHAVALYPRIDGRGELANLGIYALVTVR